MPTQFDLQLLLVLMILIFWREGWVGYFARFLNASFLLSSSVRLIFFSLINFSFRRQIWEWRRNKNSDWLEKVWFTRVITRSRRFLSILFFIIYLNSEAAFYSIVQSSPNLGDITNVLCFRDAITVLFIDRVFSSPVYKNWKCNKDYTDENAGHQGVKSLLRNFRKELNS